MQRLLAVLLILVGLIGLALGRLGETTWAPETETTATVDLADPGSAVVIDPGVLYVGGEEGQLVIEGASDVSVITAANSDIDAYLEDVRYTRITGASDWKTLSTEEVNPEGAAELTAPTTSDLWRTVETTPSPYTLEVADFWAAENGEENEQVYRELLVVTDGTAPGASTVSITWPVEAENEWVPFAYAGGAAIAVIGLVLLVVSIGGRRRDEDEDTELEGAPPEPGQDEHTAAPVGVAAATAGAATAGASEADASEDEAGIPAQSSADPALTADDADPVDPVGPTDPAAGAAPSDPGSDPLFGIGSEEPREDSVWSLGESSTPADTEADEHGPSRLFGDDEDRR